MKFSDKGKAKILDNRYWFLEEFNQDDFEGAIILSIEEANLLFKVIDGFFDLRLPTTKEIIALNKLKVQIERIEKTEMQDEIK